MSFLKGILDDFREKRLWPVALVLVVALIAVPVLLAKSTKSQPLAQLPQTAPAAPAGLAVPAVSVSSTPTHARLRTRKRDPFSQQKLPTPRVTTPTGTATTPTGTATTPTGTATTPTGPTTPPTTTTTPTTTIPTPTPKPAIPVLTDRQSYNVTISITNAAGGLDKIDPVERLSVLPGKQQPLLVELGVLKGGHRVLFAVEPAAVVHGPGTCAPGPINCQVLSLASGQIEALSKSTTTGTAPVAMFAVTAIQAQWHSSAAAANKLRKRQSAAGRHLLRISTLNALSLFRYEPSLGAVVDLRNLSVGGG